MLQRTIRANALISRFAITHTELEVGEDVEVLDKLFFRSPPCYGAGEEGCPFMVVGEFRRTVGTHTCREEIFVVERIVDTSEERSQSLFSHITGHLFEIQRPLHVIILGHIIWEIGSLHTRIIPFSRFESEGPHHIQLMYVVESLVVSDDGFGCHALPNI